MSIELDHFVVPVRDRKASAARLAQILDVGWAESGVGPFSPVYISDGLTLDFDQVDSPYPIQHYCFRVTDTAFATILANLKKLGIRFRSQPNGPVDMQVNNRHGGSIVYWEGPDIHYWEMLTQSYDRQAGVPT